MTHDRFPDVDISKSAELIPRKIEQIKEFVESCEEGLEAKVKEVIENNPILGEGRAAKVFDLELDVQDPVCNVAVKIWRNKPKREMTPMEYAGVQWLTPKEEFQLQDELFLKGLRVPRPITFSPGEHDAMSMEKIKGYTLEEISKAGCKIATPWKELESLVIKLKNSGVVHRDLHSRNIMFETEDPLETDKPLSGKFVIIDFGLAKKFYGTSPEPEDYRISVGNETTTLPNDHSMIRKLQAGQPESVFIK